MWYNKLKFYCREPGLSTEPERDFFSRPLSEEEIRLNPHIIKLHPEFQDIIQFPIPETLVLPTDLAELLAFSNGGGIINGKREFGYFSLQGIRDFYFSYGFAKYLPYFLPIAFNGGGVFYAYHFGLVGSLPIVAVASGNLFEEDTVVLGHSIAEVLAKSYDIVEDLDQIYPMKEPSDSEKMYAKLYKELNALNEDKNKGKVDLKTFLLAKNRIKAEMKLLILK